MKSPARPGCASTSTRGDDLDALADTLAMLGLPSRTSSSTGGVPGVVTARVVRTESHPDAAKIQRVWVDAGDGRERHVWCGAFNFAPGDVVPLAPLGTTMPDGRTIARRGILGIDSEGMLCSARELGLGDDHTGILVLPAGPPLGVPYGEALGRRDDVVLDVDVTRNRPDCRSLHRRRPRPRGQARRAVHAARAAGAGRRPATRGRRRRSRSSTATAAGGSRRPCCRASSSDRRRRGWPSA